MVRSHVKTMHDIVCRGCGVGFQNHNRNRAYCSRDCRLLYQYALLRRCWAVMKKLVVARRRHITSRHSLKFSYSRPVS